MKVTFRAATQEMLKSSTLVWHVYIIFGMDGFIFFNIFVVLFYTGLYSKLCNLSQSECDHFRDERVSLHGSYCLLALSVKTEPYKKKGSNLAAPVTTRLDFLDIVKKARSTKAQRVHSRALSKSMRLKIFNKIFGDKGAACLA